MEFDFINESKLKILLNAEDLDEFELSAEELDYSNTETKRMFWDILSRAKKRTGFDTDGHRVLVQLYPSKDGGCEVFVTKIIPLCDEKDGCPAFEKPQRKKKSSAKTSYTVFSFKNLRDLSSACRGLMRTGYNGDSLAYIDEKNRWYLLLANLDFSGYTPMDEFSFLLEFGSIENTETYKSYLSEHAKQVCESNAVQKLSLL